MSIFEIILEQKIILISVIVALVPLLAAVALFILPRVRRAVARRKARAAEIAAARAERAEQQAAVPARTAPANKPVASQPGQPQIPSAQPSMPAPAPGGMPEPETAAPQPETPAAPEQSGQPGATSSGLNDLLSVFGETEDDGDRALLLEGLDPVDMAQLAALSHEVADQLRAQAR
ncbi:MAG: hypothetical protein H6671_16400 [Anaerolineaceae bacterium]|nr:hypothetical protein [Anaerolineaceae bacterium]